MRLFASRSLRKSIYPRRSMLFRHISEKCAKRRVIRDNGTGFSAIALSRVNFSIAKKKKARLWHFESFSMLLAWLFRRQYRRWKSNVRSKSFPPSRVSYKARDFFLYYACWMYVCALYQPVVAPTEFYRTTAPKCCEIKVLRR